MFRRLSADSSRALRQRLVAVWGSRSHHDKEKNSEYHGLKPVIFKEQTPERQAMMLGMATDFYNFVKDKPEMSHTAQQTAMRIEEMMKDLEEIRNKAEAEANPSHTTGEEKSSDPSQHKK